MNKEQGTVNKTEIYNWIKVFCMIFVVIGHITRMYTGEGIIVPKETSTFLKGCNEYIYAFHMPLFIMISGCVFGYGMECGKYCNDGKFYLNKAKRLLVPYLMFGIFYVAPVMCLFSFTEKNYGNYIAYGILLGKEPRHLWYLLVLFLIFATIIFLRKLIGKKVPMLIMFGVFFIISFLSQYAPKTLQIFNFCKYYIFFFLGICINLYWTKVVRLLKNRVLVVIAVLIYASRSFTNDNNFAFLYAVVGSYIVFALAIKMQKKMDGRIFKELLQCSFGIYLFHPMIIYICFYYWGKYHINPILLSVVVFVITFSISYMATKGIKYCDKYTRGSFLKI